MEPNTTIGRYQIQSLLGKGGMGEVYKAFDPGLDRTVALKTIRPDNDNPTFLDRLYREAKACGRLHHPGIVTVYDIGDVDGVVFIAMEYLEGQHLGAAVASGKLSFEAKIKILVQILEALEYAHKEGVVHRDIKPSNIHVLVNGDIKILDFGLARVARAESLTATGAVMGTPFYMSPEQLKGQKVDGRSDIFSTGVLAYELFTHRRAFEGEGITTVMLKVLSDPAPPMDTAFSIAFPEIERIVTRAMAKSVDDRFATAEDMKNALVSFLHSSHASISKTEADVDIKTTRALAEAATLLKAGDAEQSQAILAQTLKLNPDAREAHALFEQATLAVNQADVPTLPQLPPVPPPTPVVAAPPPPVAPKPPAPVVQQKPVAPPAPVVPKPPPFVQPPIAQEAQPPAPKKPAPVAEAPARGNRVLWLAVPIAAVVVIGVAALVMGQKPAPVPPGPVTNNVQPAPTPAPVVEPTPAPPAAVVTPAATPPPSIPNAPNRAAVGAKNTVQIEAGGDTALSTALSEALKARDIPVQTGAAGARLSVRATQTTSVRKSPFENSSALTADFTGTLQVRDSASNSRKTLSFDGHAMEFGEAVVKQAAIRQLADQMADAIKDAVAIK